MSTFRETLPRIYQKDPGMGSLVDTADTIAEGLYGKVNALRDFLNPDLTTAAGLDFIAREILDLKTWFWQDNWLEPWKRATLKNYPRLVVERGNKTLIPWLFNLYNLNVTIREGGWILDTTVFPILLGANWDDLILYIPQTYTKSTPEYQMIQAIIKWFIPDLVTVTINYF
jgi:hypothetical protein